MEFDNCQEEEQGEEEVEQEAEEEARRLPNKTALLMQASTSHPSGLAPVTRYRECLKNHAVSIGGHAIDGCGEFMASGPHGLKCDACGCHRSFHRRENIVVPPPSPLPLSRVEPAGDAGINLDQRKKRHRTKFTPEQKGRMMELAEKIGWRIHKQDESLVQRFCEETGVKRHVLKVWMHNNKHTLGKGLKNSVSSSSARD